MVIAIRAYMGHSKKEDFAMMGLRFLADSAVEADSESDTGHTRYPNAGSYAADARELQDANMQSHVAGPAAKDIVK
jgi:hypothetical protein